jgi:hypothetical protein
MMNHESDALASQPASGEAPTKDLLRQREVGHPIYSPPRYSDPSDAELGSADTQPDPLLPDPVAPVEAAPTAPGVAPDTAQPEQQFAVGPVTSARPKPRLVAQFGRYAAASALLGLLYLGSNHLPVDDYLTKIRGVVMPASPSAPEAAPEAAPVTEAKVAATAPVVETSLIPAAASLRPKGPAAPTAVAPLPLHPVAAADIDAPAATPVSPPVAAPVLTEEPAVKAAGAEANAAPATVAAAEAASAESAVPAALVAADAPADATSDAPVPQATEASLLAVLPLPSLGQLALVLPVLGAVLLALAALALMRGRQAEPPAAFAGRDPWEKLAREARSTQGDARGKG